MTGISILEPVAFSGMLLGMLAEGVSNAGKLHFWQLYEPQIRNDFIGSNQSGAGILYIIFKGVFLLF